MVTKFNFENRTAGPINIIVEPEAVNFILQVGKSVVVELNCEQGVGDEKLDMIIEADRMIIYQNQCAMKIYVDNELQYW